MASGPETIVAHDEDFPAGAVVPPIQMMAAAVLALIPACLLFAFIQRYLMQGLTVGAVKG